MPVKKFKKAEVCKPCWELKYCPYGVLVEMMPLPSATEDGKGRFEPAANDSKGQDQLYAQAKQGLRETDFSNDNELWNNMFHVMYADQFKWQAVGEYRPTEVGCNIFGHVCPVFFFGSLNVTETRSMRRRGRYIPRDIMLKVVRRDDHRCQECGEHVSDDEVEFDHVIPHSNGGPLTVENIRLLCRACNRTKSDSLSTLLEDWKEDPSPEGR